MDINEQIHRYIDHVRKTYHESLWDIETQNVFAQSIKGKLDSLVASGALHSHNFSGIDFAEDRFEFSIVHVEGDTSTLNFKLDINHYHGRTSPD